MELLAIGGEALLATVAAFAAIFGGVGIAIIAVVISTPAPEPDFVYLYNPKIRGES